MVALFVQTFLLLAAAYFLGAALACILRRSLSTAPRPQLLPARPVEPLPEMVRASRARFGGGAVGEPAPPPRAPVVPAAPAVAPAAAPAPAQDLKRIRAIDVDLEARLNRLGVRRYDEIAAWMQADVARIGGTLKLGDRISRENWIEQAQVLAKGALTHYAMRLARGEIARAAPTTDEGEPRNLAGATTMAAARPAVSERAAFARASEQTPPTAAPGIVTVPAVPMRPAATAARDNLQRIGGVDAGVEGQLAAQGVTRYAQIAQWSPADVARFEGLVGAMGRIGRENWIEQAQILSRGGDTAFSRDYDRRSAASGGEVAVPAGTGAAAQSRGDLGFLRSVRSAAYHGATSLPQTQRPAQFEDLKRIRGIGVLIEKRLNQLGVVSYEQIANWTADEIARVSQSLDFKGRIERENWVEQARILASGGATEFSRRVDRGEVETSRYRP